MRLARESLLIWLGLVVVLAGHIKTQPPIVTWGQNEWIELLILAVTWGLGKLQSSPLPGKNDPSDDDRIAPRPDRSTGPWGGAALLLLLGASPAFAQTAPLPHNIPHACATDPTRTVVPTGQLQTLSGSHSCIEVRGDAVVAARLITNDLICYPGASLTFANGSETFIRGTPIDVTADPDQWTRMIAAVNCKVRAAGDPKTPAVRMLEASAGATTITVPVEPSGWQPGDRLYLPDTRQLQLGAAYAPQWEEATIASAMGTTITLTAPLRFAHFGARDVTNAIVALPHVLNLTRSIVIRSEQPAGVRGHFVATGRADVDLRGVLFLDFGRTTNAAGSIRGRYAWHAHHLDGPQGLPATTPQYVLDGNVFLNSTKWPIAVHNTHYGAVRNNVVVGYEGAGIVTEDGSETANVIEDNFVFRGERSVGNRNAGGTEGVAFYFRGPNNFVRRNVAGNVQGQTVNAAYGFKFAMEHLGIIPVPTGKGETTRRSIDAHTIPLPAFEDNECYGAIDSCLTYWWLGTPGVGPTSVTGRSVFKRMIAWHVTHNAIYHYEGAKIDHDGLTVYGNRAPSQAVGYHGADYKADDVRILNANIQGVNSCVEPSGFVLNTFVVQDSRLQCAGADLYLNVMYTSGGNPASLPQRSIVLRNVQLLGPTKVWFGYRADFGRNIMQRDEIRIEDAAGVRDVFWEQSAAGFVPPPSSTGFCGSPEAGMTNAQLWAKYATAAFGRLADCTTKPSGTRGVFVCASGNTPPPPPPPIDSDGDGVPDSLDKCAATPAGTPVDASGCPLPPPPPPPPTDSDGDGVPDSLDKCAGTPAGTPVDASGCPIVTPQPPPIDVAAAEAALAQLETLIVALIAVRDLFRKALGK